MSRAEIISNLLRSASVTAPDLLAADVAGALVDAGGDHLVLYVIDYEQKTLQPVGVASGLLGEAAEGVPVDGTMAGRAFQTQQVLSTRTDRGWRFWAPLQERAERIGVLEAEFIAIDDETAALCADLGLLVGHLMRTTGRYTDMIELHRRRSDMSLSAEMQWDMLLPPLAFACPGVAVAGLVEPAYEVGGDGFDYSLNGDILSFAVLDAMGHGLRSALASALTLAGHRYSRRRGMDLVETARSIDETLVGEFDGELFVTAHLGQLDTVTGELSWINAGHPDPLLVRSARVVEQLHAEPCLPLGLGITIPEIGERRLQPGDKILYFSDGVVEARPPAGEQFGSGRLIELLERHLSSHLVTAELLRRVIMAVVEHRSLALQDDASLMLINWRPDA